MGNELAHSGRREDSRAHGDRYALLFNLAPVALISIDLGNRIVDLNPAASRLLRVERDAALGASFASFIESPDVVAYHRRLRLASETQAKQAIELNLVVEKERRPRVVPVRIDCLPSDGAEAYFLSIVDFSSLHATQESLAREKRRMLAILDAASDAILTIDASGRVLTSNPAATSMFAYRSGDLLGAAIESLLPGFDSSRLAGGVVLEQSARRRNGSSFPVHVSLAELDDADGGFCAFIRDLSRVRKVEEELRHAHKMEAIGTLASGVAHDFNNLLMGVAGCVEIAMDSLEENCVARMYLQEVADAAANGVEIASQLLTFGRREQAAHPAVFELNELVAKQMKMIRRLVGPRIAFKVSLDASDSRIRADPSSIIQILMNLAVNARDALPDGGTLEFRTSMVSSGDPDGAGRYVALRVSDNGCGMPSEVRERAFDPFYTTKPPGSGTGLGLSMVYGIVKQANGSIRLESEEGEGTTFVLQFPLVRKRITREFPALVNAPELDGGSETILLVEDEPRVRLVLRNYLERAGYRVLEAATGRAAIDCCRTFAGTVDLLITDMVLPSMNGDRVALEVGKLKPGARVLYVSAHTPKWLRGLGRIDQNAPILQKPMSANKLLRSVRAILDDQPLPGPPEEDGESAERGRILVVCESRPARLAVAQHLSGEGWSVVCAASATEAGERFFAQGGDFKAVVVDWSLPDGRGVAVARLVKSQAPMARVIYLGDQPDGETPPGLFIQKPINLSELAGAIFEHRDLA